MQLREGGRIEVKDSRSRGRRKRSRVVRGGLRRKEVKYKEEENGRGRAKETDEAGGRKNDGEEGKIGEREERRGEGGPNWERGGVSVSYIARSRASLNSVDLL